MMPNSPAPSSSAQGSAARKFWLAALAAVGGLALGALLHLATTFLEQNGPRIGPFAFNGNGATVIPFCVLPLILIVAIVVLAIRRAYVPMVLFAVGLIAGFAALGAF